MTNSQSIGTNFIDGLRAPHYINGRLLTAEDLRADQEAMLARLGWLGKASGYGVIEGLVVTQASSSSVQVTPGIGLNRSGHVLRLVGSVTLPLNPQTDDPQPPPDAGRFKDCVLQGTSGSSSRPGGTYLLSVVPASRLEGQAPVKGMGANPSTCAARWEVEGLQFKATRLTAFDPDAEGMTADNRRNLLAHWCFGSQALPALALDPFNFGDQFGGLELLDALDLTPCDLPLAVFHWTGSALTFVDRWAVRRRPVQPLPSASWRGLLSDRRVADGEARFLQFQDQLAGMASGTSSIIAMEHFPYLPPVGYLPIRPDRGLVAWLAGLAFQAYHQELGSTYKFAGQGYRLQQYLTTMDRPTLIMARLPAAGFDLATFFEDIEPTDVGLIGRESVDSLLQQSWYDEALDLSDEPRYNLYFVRDPWLRIVAEELGKLVDAHINTITSLPTYMRDIIRNDWREMVETYVSQQSGRNVRGQVDWSGGVKLSGPLYAIFAKSVEPVLWLTT